MSIHAIPAPMSPGLSSGSARGLAWGAAVILILGSLLFLSGGRAHPAISVAIGAGPDDFFRAFAEKVQHTGGWHAMHMLILIGPLCWAIAAPALLDAIHPAARGLTSVARSALLLSGALWAVAFVLDGFGAPVYANALTAAGSSSIDAGVLASFQANAIMMSRLGLVSWVAGGLGIVILGGSLLAPIVRTPWRVAVGVSGILIGAWPLIAAVEGEYAGGPFTSQYWMENALAVGVWYFALASCGLRSRLPDRGAYPR
ncbi:MAG: hypothetical protein M3373_11710 [Gemmatimonadota bacterium]|nr:hypothetical protein [Gemmatimonadota bacterium]